MELSKDQAAAMAQFEEWKAGSGTLFMLLGYGGTGKTTLTNMILDASLGATPPGGESINDLLDALTGSIPMEETVICAPSHKALGVTRRMLGTHGRPFEIGYDQYLHEPGALITATTQSALGMHPVITENETGSGKRTFGMDERGSFLLKLPRLRWLIIDEVSMLSWSQLKQLQRMAKAFDYRIIAIGDPGQLPPVQAQEIKWDKVRNTAWLREVMRQADGSAVPLLGQAVRDDEDWRSVTGPGVTHETRVLADFIASLDRPATMDELESDVAVAYKNRTVDRINDAACQKLYGHGAGQFMPGEVVLATGAFYAGTGRSKKPVCTNQERLKVLSFEEGRGQFGAQVRMLNSRGREFTAEYLTDAERLNGPYADALNAALNHARAISDEWKATGRPGHLNAARIAAWQDFYALKDNTVLGFVHPYAITSHKSQGSTYRNVWVAGTEIAGFGSRGLYVAATRPRENLVIG